MGVQIVHDKYNLISVRIAHIHFTKRSTEIGADIVTDRTARILKKFDYTELPMADELIADLYVLDDITRRDLFEYAKVLKKNHTSPERAADLKDMK